MTTNQIQPKFYDANVAMRPFQSTPAIGSYESRVRNRSTKTSTYEPEQYFRMWHDRLVAENRNMRRLAEMYVTLHRRFRGVTIDDDFGYFGTRPETRGYWINHDPEDDGPIHPINIVRPDIRANVAALLQVNVGIDVEPVNQEAKNRERAQRIQFLADFFERDTWTEGERTLIFDAIHKEGTVLLEVFLDRDRGCEQTIASSNQVSSKVAKFKCDECGQTATKEISADEAEMYHQPTIACPDCKGSAQVLVEDLDNYELQEETYRQAEISHRRHSGFNFIIDREGAAENGIQTARYLQTMRLASRADLESDYPQFQFEAPFDWSYQLKCKYALASADWSLLYSNWAPTMESSEWDLFEKKRIFLHESAYKNYVSPIDWEFVDGHGRAKLDVKRGETWKEALARQYGKDCDGLRLVFVNERLIDIETPPDFEPNFRKCFTDVHFLRDSGSYHSTPHWDSVKMQDTITLFNTIKTNTAARNSVEPVWFNSEVFDINDFSREFIPSKDGALDPGVDIQTSVFKPPTARAADSINEHLVFLLGLRREVSGVQPALLGEAQPNQPYAAQRQQLEQSFGLLTPASKSYAQMKVQSTVQKIRFAFKNWTLEQFQSVASRNGEVWNEADVAELVSTDLSRDVIIDYVPGTEVPQGNLTKELKLWNGIQQAMPLIQFAAQMGILDPKVVLDLLAKIDETADFGLDMSGNEIADAIGQKRYAAVAAACEEYRGLRHEDILAMQSQIVNQEPVTDEMGNPVVDPMTGAPAVNTVTAFSIIEQEIMTAADVSLHPLEDPAKAIKFFTVEILRELAKPETNFLLVEMLTTIVSQFGNVIAEAEAQAGDPAAEANDADRESKTADRESKDADRESRTAESEAGRGHASEEADKKREHELKMKMLDHAEADDDRDFQAEQAAKQPVPAE